MFGNGNPSAGDKPVCVGDVGHNIASYMCLFIAVTLLKGSYQDKPQYLILYVFVCCCFIKGHISIGFNILSYMCLFVGVALFEVISVCGPYSGYNVESSESYQTLPKLKYYG